MGTQVDFSRGIAPDGGLFACPGDCSGNGACLADIGECMCLLGSSGDACEIGTASPTASPTASSTVSPTVSSTVSPTASPGDDALPCCDDRLLLFGMTAVSVLCNPMCR